MNVTTMHQLAHDWTNKKPKKAEAAAILSRLAEELPEAAMQDVALLYKYFVPAPPKKPKNVFQWTAKAASKDQFRAAMCNVYYDHDETRIVTTDTHRLHIAPSEGIENAHGSAFYFAKHPEPLALPDSEQDSLVFPRYGSVVDSCSNMPRVDLDGRTGVDGQISYIRIAGDSCVNLIYWNDAISMGEPDSIYCTGTVGEPVRLEWNDGRIAIIMPVRIDV